MHQAHQLSWRLYNSLNENHLNQIENGYESYLDNVIKSSRDEIPHASPGTSPYFIWSARSVCEIMRGNIYRQIDYMKPSERYYSHALDRFRRLLHHCRMAKCREQNESPSAANNNRMQKTLLVSNGFDTDIELKAIDYPRSLVKITPVSVKVKARSSVTIEVEQTVAATAEEDALGSITFEFTGPENERTTVPLVTYYKRKP
jgi:hypothetical protein